MTLGFDISLLMYEGSGVATYTKNLITNLLDFFPNNQYKFFYSSFRKPAAYFDFISKVKNKAEIFTYHIPPRFFNLLWNKYHYIEIEKLVGPVDVFHSSDYLRPPLQKKTLSLTTIHDLTWKKFPQFHTPDIIRLHENKLRKTIKYHDTIIVNSENTKKDLLHYFPECRRNDIYTILLGIDDRFRVIKDQKKISRVLKKYNISYSSNFLLYVGAIEPRKNLERSIKIFNELLKEKKYSNYKFLLVGRAGWKNDEVFKLIKRLHLEEKITFVGYVSADDLPYFYNAASANIYLSLYEGFGLPPLEAAKCGTPSLIYKNSSLAETFPKDYPFAIVNKEITTLKNILDRKVKLPMSYFNRYNWKDYTEKYMKIINTNIK